MRNKQSLQVTILGCGTSTGVPLIHCDCKICKSKNPKNKRLRASIFVEVRGKCFLIDTSTDLRQQAIQNKLKRIDTILFTHPHADHVSGIDEVRSFNYIQKEVIPAFGNQWTYHELKSRYPYIFTPKGKPEGGIVPQIDLKLLDAKIHSFKTQGIDIIPISVMHGSQECVGYRIDSFAYMTDCSYIPDDSFQRLRDLDLLILDCVRIAPHNTHLNLERALEVVNRLKPRQTVLTHLSHDFDYTEWTRRSKKAKLPKGVTLAYDGMKIKI